MRERKNTPIDGCGIRCLVEALGERARGSGLKLPGVTWRRPPAREIEEIEPNDMEIMELEMEAELPPTPVEQHVASAAHRAQWLREEGIAI